MIRQMAPQVQNKSSSPSASGVLQRKCNGCGKKDKLLQRSAASSAPEAVPPVVHEVLRSPGAPMDAETQTLIESRFGHDLSRIRAHTNNPQTAGNDLMIGSSDSHEELEAGRLADTSKQPPSVDVPNGRRSLFRLDLGQVRVHTDPKAAESARAANALAYTVGRDIVFGSQQYSPRTQEGQRLIAHELAHVAQQAGSSARCIQRDEAGKGEKTKEKTGAGTKSEPKSQAGDGAPCNQKSRAESYTPTDKSPNGNEVKVDLGSTEFGNTSKLGAYFQFGACKAKDGWHFYLDSLSVPIASKVQPIDFRINVDTANDKVVTKDTYLDIVKDLRPNRKVKFPLSCGGNKFTDEVTTYSVRKKYWNRQMVVDHEAFHRSDWNKSYRPELITAEKEVWRHSLPSAEAASAKDAIGKADKTLTGFMIDAYQQTCKAYTPKQESNAYDAGAQQYQKLVDDVENRAKKEKW